MFTLLMGIFIVLAVVGGIGIAFMFLAKDDKIQKIAFYAVAAVGMVCAFLTATGLPSNLIVQQIVAWGFGILAFAGIAVNVKNPEKRQTAKYLVSISAIFGFVYLILL